jgi:stearoyl-CoA desaturase (delta-9 desaturase)
VGWYHLLSLRLYRDPRACGEQLAHLSRGALYVAMLCLVVPFTPRGRWVDVGIALFAADAINTFVDTALERHSRPSGLPHGEYMVHVAGSVLVGAAAMAYGFEAWPMRGQASALVARTGLGGWGWLPVAVVAAVVLVEAALHARARWAQRTADTAATNAPGGVAGRVEVSWPKTLWLYTNLALGLAAVPSALSLKTAVGGFALAFVTLCLGHSVGLHRGVIHRTYDTSRSVRCVLATLFVLAGLGGPIAWMRVHFTRDHWQNRDACPPFFSYDHGALRDYHWNLHCRFVPARDADYGIPESDLRDPYLVFLERTWFLWPVLLAVAVAATFGPAVAGVTCCLRVAVGVLGHWFVGFVSHKVGYVRYAVAGASAEGRNVFFLGVLSFGEGFHNNHHAAPGSARMGVKWYELDAGWLVVRALEALGVVRNVRAWHRPGFEAKPSARAVAPHFILR